MHMFLLVSVFLIIGDFAKLVMQSTLKNDEGNTKIKLTGPNTEKFLNDIKVK